MDEQRPAGSGAPGTNQEARERIEKVAEAGFPSSPAASPTFATSGKQDGRKGKERRGERKEPKTARSGGWEGKACSKQKTSRAKQRRERVEDETKDESHGSGRPASRRSTWAWSLVLPCGLETGRERGCSPVCLSVSQAQSGQGTACKKDVVKRRRPPRATNDAGETEARLSCPMMGGGLFWTCSCKGKRCRGWRDWRGLARSAGPPGLPEDCAARHPETGDGRCMPPTNPNPTLEPTRCARFFRPSPYPWQWTERHRQARLPRARRPETCDRWQRCCLEDQTRWSPCAARVTGAGPAVHRVRVADAPLNGLAGQSSAGLRLPRSNPSKPATVAAIAPDTGLSLAHPSNTCASILRRAKYGRTSIRTRASRSNTEHRKQPTHQAPARLTR